MTICKHLVKLIIVNFKTARPEYDSTNTKKIRFVFLKKSCSGVWIKIYVLLTCLQRLKRGEGTSLRLFNFIDCEQINHKFLHDAAAELCSPIIAAEGMTPGINNY